MTHCSALDVLNASYFPIIVLVCPRNLQIIQGLSREVLGRGVAGGKDEVSENK